MSHDSTTIRISGSRCAAMISRYRSDRTSRRRWNARGRRSSWGRSAPRRPGLLRSGWRSSILIGSMLAKVVKAGRTLMPILLALPLAAQQAPPQPPTHDISMVDAVSLGSAMATPLPEAQRKQLQKYDLPELAGSSQAHGSQLINGELPQPLVDYFARDAKIQQRLSIFQGGLVVIDVRGAGGPIRKPVILPRE